MGARLKLPSWVLGGQDFRAPTPAPSLSSSSPGLAGLPALPVLAAFLLPQLPAPVPGSHHPASRPRAPPSAAPRSGPTGQCSHRGERRAASAGVLGTLRGREFARTAQRHLRSARAHARSWANAPPTSRTAGRSAAEPSPPPAASFRNLLN